MGLSINVRRVDGVVVLELAGRVSVFERNLLHVALDLIDSGERFFLLGMANVSYLDNSGLGQLCWIYTALKKRGGDLKLLQPADRLKKLLSVTKLDTVFRSFEHESEAIAAMDPFNQALSA